MDTTPSEQLNRACFCITLDRPALERALRREAEDASFCDRFLPSRPHLFSGASVFVQRAQIDAMVRTVRAIEAAAALPGYRSAVLAWAPEIAGLDFGPKGVFMGYDFHLGSDGPRLIEINTNAGGAFLNALMVRAHHACCSEVAAMVDLPHPPAVEGRIVEMFRSEWRRQRGGAPLTRIAIVDDAPEEQFLYPEFVLAHQLFRRHGVDAVIADAAHLRFEESRLWAGDTPVDLVYNRLVDFALEDPRHAALRRAYEEGAAVVTPHPRVHALFADKSNLTLLSSPAELRSFGLEEASIADLATVPHTVRVTPDNSEALWAGRKTLFFKPARGHASKAVYRGDKLTRRVWNEVLGSSYVAQELAPPSERVVEIDGERVTRKVDLRLYVYDGEVLLTAARLYQGQTTNFRTPGGGFAPVFVV